MVTRKLGYSDLELSTVGLGTWAIGGPWEFGWGAQNDFESIDTIRRAVELGINWVDTAPCYGLGHSETIVGQALHDIRDQVIIATKCGLVWENPESGNVVSQLKAWSVRKEVEDSLRRLGVDYIDLYQIHWPNPDEDIEEAWEEIAKLMEEKKVRYAGVSNFNLGQLERARNIAPIASLQPPYSMFERRIEVDILDYCNEYDIGIVAYSPLQAGLLTGKFSHDVLASLPEDDWRRQNRHFKGDLFDRHLVAIDSLRQIAGRNGRSPSELAIAWVLSRREITSAIVGARKPDHIEQNVTAMSWDLSEDIIHEVEAILSK